MIALLCTADVLAQSKRSNLPNDLLREIAELDEVSFCMEADNLSIKQFAAKFFDVKAANLDGKGQPELIIVANGPCYGASGTQVWIYRKVGTRWEQLFNSPAQQQMITVAKTSTNGLRDIFRDSGNIFVRYVRTYRFNSSKYIGKECFTKTYGYTDRSGVYRKYKTPKIAKGCGT